MLLLGVFTHTHTHTWMAILCLSHGDVAVRMERAEGAKLCILQEQHGFGSQAHRHHGDDVGVFQLV